MDQAVRIICLESPSARFGAQKQVKILFIFRICIEIIN
jgi:hypothetical protein